MLTFEEFVRFIDEGVLKEEIRLTLRPGGMKTSVVRGGGRVVNISDVYKDNRFFQDWDLYTGYKTQSLIMSPIVDGDTGKVLGLVEMINKKCDGSGNTFTSFTANDEKLLEMLCNHAAIFLKTLSDIFVK